MYSTLETKENKSEFPVHHARKHNLRQEQREIKEKVK